MGSNFASELANGIGGYSLEQSIAIHLSSNHYPPGPATMVGPCIQAIDASNEGALFDLIELPEGVLWKGKTKAPAYAIVENHHLDEWVTYEEF